MLLAGFEMRDAEELNWFFNVSRSDCEKAKALALAYGHKSER